MAGPFFLYHGGDNSDGLSFTTAWQTLATAITNLAAGETLKGASDHSEAPGSTR